MSTKYVVKSYILNSSSKTIKGPEVIECIGLIACEGAPTVLGFNNEGKGCHTKWKNVLKTATWSSPTLMQFLDIIEEVESGGDSDAVGDNGASFGLLQIQMPYLMDALRHLNNLTLNEIAKDKWLSRVVFITYMSLYKKEALDSLNYEALSRTHNGGPKGDSKEATKHYWTKVQEIAKKKGFTL